MKGDVGMRGIFDFMNKRMKIEKYTLYKVYKDIYKEDGFFVNRKYQRKLVWTLEEKQALIDTIFCEYPVPMFLIAVDYTDEGSQWEIIDGLQRLDTITSFISGCFPVKIGDYFGYFNLDAFTGYGRKIEEGLILQKTPILPLELCERFLDYEIAFSMVEKANSNVEEIFRRINSTGRKLSRQDLRQAGVTGTFSDLVRKTAMYIRGDYTESDIIKLSKMSDYSLSNKKLLYGIDVNDIFWVKENIISDNGIRRSKDEEIIASIYLYLMCNGDNAASASALDNVYTVGSKFKQNVDDIVLTGDEIIEWMDVFSQVISIIQSALGGARFSSKLFDRENVFNCDYVFLILFCAIASLQLDNMQLTNEHKLAKSFTNLGNNELSDISRQSKVVWNKNVRNRLVSRVKSVLRPCFSYKTTSGNEFETWNLKMVNFLERAHAEEQMYDFKAGVTDFKRGSFDKGCVSKIVMTLSAMVNTKPNEAGYVLLGVPDDDDSAEKISCELGTNLESCNHYKILGIQAEANKYYHGVDFYLKKIKEVIEHEPISDSFRNEILTNCHQVFYKDKLLYLFVCRSEEPVFYDKKLYVRYGSHNHLVESGSEEFKSVLKKFYSV